jgi:formate-dependent nitrite reductase cytochrome c552 subunit
MRWNAYDHCIANRGVPVDRTHATLRVTRPTFIEGIRALRASQGVKDYDVNTMATRQEMRSYVCGQCHVTYYPSGRLNTSVWSLKTSRSAFTS